MTVRRVHDRKITELCELFLRGLEARPSVYVKACAGNRPVIILTSSDES